MLPCNCAEEPLDLMEEAHKACESVINSYHTHPVAHVLWQLEDDREVCQMHDLRLQIELQGRGHSMCTLCLRDPEFSES